MRNFNLYTDMIEMFVGLAWSDLPSEKETAIMGMGIVGYSEAIDEKL